MEDADCESYLSSRLRHSSSRINLSVQNWFKVKEGKDKHYMYVREREKGKETTTVSING